MRIRHKPVELIPFKLHNIKDFVVEKHPIIFPESIQYRLYWEEQTKYCIEGKWGHDYNEETGEGGYRYMPGNLYFYINMCVIEDTGLDKSTGDISPLLRDIEWLIFYALVACDGFSGFEDDEEYTCFRPIEKIEKEEQLSGIEEIMIEKFSDRLRKPDGTFKKYIEARDYLYQTFKEPMGRPHFLNEALSLILLSTRGGGKSYSMSGGTIAYDFTFNGATTVEEFYKGSTVANVVVGSIDSEYSGDLLDKFARNQEYLRTKVGAYMQNGYNYPGWFYHPTSGTLSTKGQVYTNRVRDKSGQGWIGPGSKIHHVTFFNDPQAAVGKRSKRIIVEEAGLLTNFADVHRENKATQSRDTRFGYTAYIGTGGNMKKIRDIQKAYNNPIAYDILPFEDKFSGTGRKVGLFIPAYYRKNIYKDENGNTDVDKAWKDEMMTRDKVKQEDGSKAYDGHIISYPIVPSEMFLEAGDNIFPTDRAQERLMELEEGLWAKKATIGRLEYLDSNNTVVHFVPDVGGKLKPIIRTGEEDSMKNKDGAIIIYEHPIADRPAPTFTRAQYIVVYDPIRDPDDGSSLCSVLVFKMWQLTDLNKIQFNIVAEWIGRKVGLPENHEMAVKLAHYYDAKILPEINIKHFLLYMNKQRKFDMLQPKPGEAIDGIINQKKKYEVGVYVSPGMKPDLESYANELLRTEIRRYESISGNLHTVKKILMVDQIWSIRLLEEIIAYRREGNFDHMSSLFLLGLHVAQHNKEPMKQEELEENIRRNENLKNLMTVAGEQEEYNPAFDY